MAAAKIWWTTNCGGPRHPSHIFQFTPQKEPLLYIQLKVWKNAKRYFAHSV